MKGRLLAGALLLAVAFSATMGSTAWGRVTFKDREVNDTPQRFLKVMGISGSLLVISVTLCDCPTPDFPPCPRGYRKVGSQYWVNYKLKDSQGLEDLSPEALVRAIWRTCKTKKGICGSKVSATFCNPRR